MTKLHDLTVPAVLGHMPKIRIGVEKTSSRCQNSDCSKIYKAADFSLIEYYMSGLHPTVLKQLLCDHENQFRPSLHTVGLKRKHYSHEDINWFLRFDIRIGGLTGHSTGHLVLRLTSLGGII
jgi:hypothetical protein